MRSLFLAALLLGGCRIDLDKPGTIMGSDMPTCSDATSQACMDATSHQDFTWIQANILDKQCTFSGCHNGANTIAGKIDFTAGNSYAHLVGASSMLQPSRQLVVAGDPAKSYIEVMLGIITPDMADPPAAPIDSSIGYMPMNNAGMLVCCQKLGAIDRWIAAGAMND